jgi:hypothetical protein
MSKLIKLVAIALVLVSLVLTLDYLIGRKQEAIISEKIARIRQLEIQAFYMLSAEIRNVEETSDVKKSGKYEVLLRIDNVGDEPAYISHPEVKAFVQTGRISWTEVPVSEKKAEIGKQMYVIDKQEQTVFRKLVTIDRHLPYNQHLMPKYMHVRFYIVMYVLPESGFKGGEVVERRSSTYVYVKPFYVSNEEIRKVIDFGDTEVPTYMPITAFRNWSKTKCC